MSRRSTWRPTAQANFSRLSKVVIDVPTGNHDREVSFWAATLGEPLPPPFERHLEYHGAAPHGQEFLVRSLATPSVGART